MSDAALSMYIKEGVEVNISVEEGFNPEDYVLCVRKKGSKESYGVTLDTLKQWLLGQY